MNSPNPPGSPSGDYSVLKDRSNMYADVLTPLTSDGSRIAHRNADPLPYLIVTTGWNPRLILLLLNGILSTCWGIALFVFAWPGGILPPPDGWVGLHPIITNTLVVFVATLSTIHVTYIIQCMVAEYSHTLMAEGFTMRQLKWMQGVQALSIFPQFSNDEGFNKYCGGFFTKRWLLWAATYAGLAFHTSSFVAIFQIATFTNYYPQPQYLPVPCGKDLSSLSLGVEQSLNETQQTIIDSFSFYAGMQIGSYAEQLSVDAVTSAVGVRYTKDNCAYGLPGVGAPIEYIQDIPGVIFMAQCSDNPALNSTTIWRSVFPDRFPPNVSTLSDGSHNFIDNSIPPQIQIVLSEPGPFNITESHGAMYALVEPSGNGAFVGISARLSESSVDQSFSTLVCSWTTTPEIVHAHISNGSTTISSVNNTDKYPALTGRATLKTLEGMAQGYRLGASLRSTLDNLDVLALQHLKVGVVERTAHPASIIIQTLLADGGKASMSVYNALGHRLNTSMCSSNFIEVGHYQRFAQSHGLGWVAVILTTGIGVFAVITVLRLKRRKRVTSLNVLQAAEAFAFGRGASPRDDEVFCVRDGVLVEL